MEFAPNVKKEIFSYWKMAFPLIKRVYPLKQAQFTPRKLITKHETVNRKKVKSKGSNTTEPRNEEFRFPTIHILSKVNKYCVTFFVRLG